MEEKPVYFVLGLKLVPRPEQNLQTVINEINRKINLWSRSQDLSQKAQLASYQKLKADLQGPNGYSVWNTELHKAQTYAEGRFNSRLQMFRGSQMTEVQLEYYKSLKEFLDFYTPEEIEKKILALGVKIQHHQTQPLPMPTSPKPPQNPNAKPPLPVHARMIETDLQLLNRGDLYKLLADPIDSQGKLTMISLGTEDPDRMRKASCDVLRQRALDITKELVNFRMRFAQEPTYNALNELCSLCSSQIFRDENTKAGYDLYRKELPLKGLKQSWDVLALNPTLPRKQYDACIDSVCHEGIPRSEAEWIVYEYFLAKGTQLEPEVTDQSTARPKQQHKASIHDVALFRSVFVDRVKSAFDADIERFKTLVSEYQQRLARYKTTSPLVSSKEAELRVSAKQLFDDFSAALKQCQCTLDDYSQKGVLDTHPEVIDAKKDLVYLTVVTENLALDTPLTEVLKCAEIFKKDGEQMVKTVDGVAYAFRWCPSGSFTMGSLASETGHMENENPQHHVTLTLGFWMLETPVTQAMWQSVMGESITQKAMQDVLGSDSCGKGDNYPMYYISWNECQEFCRRLSAKMGMTISLPTEAQWEYACRAGSLGPFAGNLDAMGWYYDNAGRMMHPVGQKQPNAWGLYDMHGNVSEWCQDWYGDYPTDPITDPTGPANGKNRVSRGGGYCYDAGSCRSASRCSFSAAEQKNGLGFRIIGYGK